MELTFIDYQFDQELSERNNEPLPTPADEIGESEFKQETVNVLTFKATRR